MGTHMRSCAKWTNQAPMKGLPHELDTEELVQTSKGLVYETF